MRLILSLVTCIAFTAIGCGGGDDASGRVETDSPQIPLQDGSTGRTTTETAPPGDASAATVHLRRIGTFESPTYLTAPPGDKRRLFVVERAARSARSATGASSRSRSSTF